MTQRDEHFRREEQTLTRIQRALQAETVAGASNALFGWIADRYGDLFTDLDGELKKANINVLFRTYISEMIAATIMAGIMGLGIGVIVAVMASMPAIMAVAVLFALPTLLATGVFAGLYLYPSWKAQQRAADIKMNLPFALNHMSAIAGSGVPPSSMFGLLVNFDEYGEISNESQKIVTKVHAFGEDITSAIREVAKETPSEDLEEILYGIVSTIETGGSLEGFLEESADRQLFNYRIERQKQIERLTTFASFYTALLVAAPLFLITILAILEVIGGTLFGLPIKSSCGVLGALLGQCQIGVIDIGAYIFIPLANTIFIIVLEVTQPEI